MRIPDQKIDEISRKSDIVAVVEKYVSLEKKGGRYWGRCPFHQEKTPSFTVTPEKNLFHCFGCQKGGSLFTFVMEVEKISFVEAAKQLAEQAGITIEVSQADRKEFSLKNNLLEFNERLVKTMQYLLHDTTDGRKALNYIQNRGISLETVKTCRLGYVPADGQWLHRFLLKKKYSGEFLVKTGLFSKRYPRFSLFSGRLVFPIIDANNRVIAFGGRVMEAGKEPKYINSPETAAFKKRANLYGMSTAVESIRQSKCFYVVEGYIDALAMIQSGILNTVAPLGTAFTDEQASYLHRYAEKAIIVMDSDMAGQKAAVKAISVLEKAGLEAEVVSLPEKSDPADIMKNKGAGSLKKILKNTINNFEYIMKNSFSGRNMTVPEGKEGVVKEIADYILTIDSDIRKSMYVKRLSERLGLDETSVYGYLEKLKRMEKPVRNRMDGQEKPKRNTVIPADYYLTLALLKKIDYFKRIRNVVSVDDLRDTRARVIFIALEELYRQESDSFDILLEKIADPEIQGDITVKLASGEFDFNTEEVIEQSVLKLREQNITRKRSSVEHTLKELNGNYDDSTRIKELLEEKMFLDKELEKIRVSMNDRNTE